MTESAIFFDWLDEKSKQVADPIALDKGIISYLKRQIDSCSGPPPVPPLRPFRPKSDPVAYLVDQERQSAA